MASLSTNVGNLATAVATQVKLLLTYINGNDGTGTAGLATTNKTLVGAINEVNAAVSAASGIDDSTTSESSTWSSSKITSEITTDVAALIVDTGTASDSVWSSTKTAAEIDALIDDSGTDTTTVWSSDKTDTEIGSQITAAVADFTEIDDVTASSTTVYSSTKTDVQILAMKTEILGGADPAFDTLKELQDALAGDTSDISDIMTALGNRVRTDTASQGLNSTQQGNARTNIAAAAASDLATLTSNVGDTTVDYSAIFAAAILA